MFYFYFIMFFPISKEVVLFVSECKYIRFILPVCFLHLCLFFIIMFLLPKPHSFIHVHDLHYVLWLKDLFNSVSTRRQPSTSLSSVSGYPLLLYYKKNLELILSFMEFWSLNKDIVRHISHLNVILSFHILSPIHAYNSFFVISTSLCIFFTINYNRG